MESLLLCSLSLSVCVSVSAGPIKVLETTHPSPHPLTNIMLGPRNERALELHLNRLQVRTIRVCVHAYSYLRVYDIIVHVYNYVYVCSTGTSTHMRTLQSFYTITKSNTCVPILTVCLPIPFRWWWRGSVCKWARARGVGAWTEGKHTGCEVYATHYSTPGSHQPLLCE